MDKRTISARRVVSLVVVSNSQCSGGCARLGWRCLGRELLAAINDGASSALGPNWAALSGLFELINMMSRWPPLIADDQDCCSQC